MEDDDNSTREGGLAKTAPAPVRQWTQWRVAPDSGFEVDSEDGSVLLAQTDRKNFAALTTFRYVDATVRADLVAKVEPKPGMSKKETVDAACTWTGADTVEGAGRTDFASIPQPLRWFENTYGRHTLAAIIHDALIVSERNGGALNSDVLADRFFREMMRTSGVAWLKRWVLWAGVAVRSRFVAGGLKTAGMVVWILAALTGITCAVGAVVAGLGGPRLLGLSTPVLALVAVVLPVGSAVLWGQQWAASLIAAIAGGWILPPIVVAAIGYVVYLGIETVAGVVPGLGRRGEVPAVKDDASRATSATPSARP